MRESQTTTLTVFQVAQLYRVHPVTVMSWTRTTSPNYDPSFPVRWQLTPRKKRYFLYSEVMNYLEKGCEQKKRV